MFQVYDDLLFKPAWPVLFALAHIVAGSNSNLTIGPGVVNPYHSHPSLIATNLACLNEETSGKSFLMIGKGAFHDVIDIRPVHPITAIREAIEIICKILSGARVDYRGSIFTAKSEAQLRWKSASRERLNPGRTIPPIWIGTWGPKMCELAGSMRQVSGVMVSSITHPGYIRFLKEKIAIGARSAGRAASEIEVGCVPGTIVSRDRGKAFSLARQASAIYLPYLDPMPEFVGVSKDEVSSVREALAKRDLKLATSLVSEKSVNAFKLWGTPDDIIEKTSKLIDNGNGISRINYGFGRGPEDIEAIELLGKKVLPYFNDQMKK